MLIPNTACMKRVSVLVSLSILGVVPGAGRAQDKPDFSGTWEMDRSRSESAHQAEPIGPVIVVIAQDAVQLSIETRRSDRTQKIIYKLDGSEARNALQGGMATSRLRWDGAKLVTVTVYDIQGWPVTALESRTLSEGAREMVVETNITVEHGYESRLTEAAPQYAAAKDIFIKRSP